MRTSGNNGYRAAAAIAIAGAFLLVWANLAVGIIGAEDNPANLMYAGVLAVALVGAAMARLRPAGMARALAATAVAQALIAGIALTLGYFTLAPDGFFVALWLLSAWLFRQAARG